MSRASSPFQPEFVLAVTVVPPFSLNWVKVGPGRRRSSRAASNRRYSRPEKVFSADSALL